MFADCRFYDFDWLWQMSRIEGYIEPSSLLLNSSLSLSRALASCPRTKAVADQQCEMKFILKNELRKHRRKTQAEQKSKVPLDNKNPSCLSLDEICATFSPTSPCSRVGRGAIVKIGRYWNLSKFPTLPMCISFSAANTNRKWWWMPNSSEIDLYHPISPMC